VRSSSIHQRLCNTIRMRTNERHPMGRCGGDLLTCEEVLTQLTDYGDTA
jgi:hypothetical protein